MKKLQANASYSLIHASMWGMYAVIIYFAKTFLKAQGLSDVMCSVVLGGTAAASVLLNVLVSELVSRIRKLKLYMATLAVVVLMLVGLAGMLASNTAVTLCGACLVLALLQLIPGMCNSLGMDAIAKGAPATYAIARGIGSFAFAVVSMIAGDLIEKMGTNAVPLISGAMGIALIGSVIWFHLCAEKGLEDVAQTEKAEKKKDNFLSKNPMFSLFLVGAALMNVSHYYLVVFLSDVTAELGLGSSVVGNASAVSTFVELPIMFGFAFLSRKFRCSSLLKLSAFMFLAKILGVMFSNGAMGIYLAHATQILGYGLYAIASVTYAGEVMGKDDAVRAQSYLAATISLGNVLAMFTGGFLIQGGGVQAMLWVAGGCALVGSLIILVSAKKTEK